mgnify:CR=1 FL=1
MTCVTRKEVERSEPFEKGLDLKSVNRTLIGILTLSILSPNL